MKKIFLILMTVILMTACSSMRSNDKEAHSYYNYSGVLAPLEMSIWQYGTHTLTTDEGDFYAVKSESIDLDEYVGQPVHIKGTEIEGYPVDNGPKFLDIEKIQLMEK